jgi:hypothetical protein
VTSENFSPPWPLAILNELADAGVSRRTFALALNAASAAIPDPYLVPLSVRCRMVTAALIAVAADSEGESDS